MVGEDIITMSMKELKKLKVLHAVLDKRFTQKAAAVKLDLSERQVRCRVIPDSIYYADLRDSVKYWTDSGWVTEGQLRASEVAP